MDTYLIQWETEESRGGFTLSGYSVGDVLAGVLSLGLGNLPKPTSLITKMTVQRKETTCSEE